jgi:3-oxoacyl-[acyl-carrier protein] reductase
MRDVLPGGWSGHPLSLYLEPKTDVVMAEDEWIECVNSGIFPRPMGVLSRASALPGNQLICLHSFSPGGDKMLSIDLTGRRALVTGGARGIGAGVVWALAECGASVAFNHRGSERGNQAASQLKSRLTALGKHIFDFTAPAEDMESMRQVVSDAAGKMGGLDIVVSNVGQNWVATLEDLDLEGWQRGLDLNLTTAFIAVKTALPWLLKARRADIVLVGSSAAIDGGGGVAHYAAAKAGLDGLTRALMRELPRRGIHINTVHPCVVDTDLLRERYDDEKKLARLVAQVPLGRLSKPQDIGALVAFLCSDLGGFICGQSILVDGGRTLWRNT